MVQNKKHCQPRMRIHGICISRSVSLIAFLSPFFLITTRRSAFSLFIHCVSSTSLPIARSPSLPLCGLPPLSLKCPSCCVSLHPPSSLHLHCLTSPLSPPPQSFPHPLCNWVADWTSSCRACWRMASLPLFNLCVLIEKSCLLDSVRCYSFTSREGLRHENSLIHSFHFSLIVWKQR